MVGLPESPAQADETIEFESIEFSPDPVVVGETLEVSCKLMDETNVSSLYINLCTSVCFPQEPMTRGSDGTYTGTSEMVTTVESYYFQISIQLDNGTVIMSDKVYFTPITHELTVESIGHEPATVKLGKKVTVTVELPTEENVSTVSLFHCQGDVCFTPVEMTRISEGVYEAEIGPFDKKEEIKYNVTVAFDDGARQWEAWTQDVKFMPEKKEDDGDDNGFIPAVGAVTAIAVLAGLAVTRRGRQA
jgi:hypothetical protein